MCLTSAQHVERDKYETRLLHLKGKRNIRAAEVDVKASSLNEGDVFLLDMGLKLFLWCGKEANSAEKGKGVEMMTAIYNTRGAKAERITIGMCAIIARLMHFCQRWMIVLARRSIEGGCI